MCQWKPANRRFRWVNDCVGRGRLEKRKKSCALKCASRAGYSGLTAFNRKLFPNKFGSSLHLVIFAARFEKNGK